MIRCCAVLLFLFAPVSLFSQTHFGFKAGLNISDIVMTNYVNPDAEADLQLKAGIHAGLFASGLIDDRLGVAAELLYSDKGVTGSERIHLHYVTIPLLFQYTLGDHLYAELGPELAYLFSARSRHGDFSGTYNNRFDMALDGGLRFDTGDFVFGLRYCVGLFSVRNPDVMAGPEKIKYQNRVLQFSIGYKLYTLE